MTSPPPRTTIKQNTPCSAKPLQYVSQYDASLLFPIPRLALKRLEKLGITANSVATHFSAWTIWNAYEVSWLEYARGKPQVAIASRLCSGADSPNIVESKSFKLYLNSFQSKHDSRIADDVLAAILAQDLSACRWCEVRR